MDSLAVDEPLDVRVGARRAIVYSRTLERADWNTTVVRDVVAQEVMELRAQPGGDLALGGADLAATFMRHDLIDEYRLYVHPIVIGRGKSMFPPLDGTIDLRLAETRSSATGSSSSATSVRTTGSSATAVPPPPDPPGG